MNNQEDLWNQITYLTNKNVKKEKEKKDMRNGNYEIKQKLNNDNIIAKAKLDVDDGNYTKEKSNFSLCQIIKQNRTKLSLTQKDIAKKLNIDSNTYGKYESGDLVPDNKILFKLQHYLKVKLTGKKSEWGKQL